MYLDVRVDKDVPSSDSIQDIGLALNGVCLREFSCDSSNICQSSYLRLGLLIYLYNEKGLESFNENPMVQMAY